MQPWNNRDGEPSWFDNSRNVRRTSSNFYGVTPTEIAPVTEPVTLAQAKTQCRVDFDDDDSYLTILMTMARRRVENWCAIAIVPKTFTCGVDIFTDFEIPYGPNATNIVLTDSIGNVIDPSAYAIIPGNYPVLKPLGMWYEGASLSWASGYAVGAVDLDLQLGILQEIAFLYENRGDSTDQRKGVNPGVSEFARISIEPYRRYAWL
jgi:uncharacterized phiE125 gp8 family phage protein